jgi:hypothetical protein
MGNLVVAVAALGLCVATLAYKAEVNAAEIRVRYAPFVTKRTAVRDVTHLVEGRTLVLVTKTSKIPLWGLTVQARQALFQVLPRRLDVPGQARPSKTVDVVANVRKHKRWTKAAGAGFVVTAALSLPFAKGNVLHGYWESVGQYVLLVSLLCFIAFVFEAGLTWVLWSAGRDIDRMEDHRGPKRR